MNKILKRLLTGVLTLATVFTALPTTAVHAAETQYWTESSERVGIVEKVMNDGSIGSTFNEGHMTVEGEDAYCVDINTNFKNGYKTRSDASTCLSDDQIADIALSLEYVKQYTASHSGISSQHAYLLRQLVVWQRLSAHLGWSCDNVRASYDEISKAVQDEVFAGAKAFVAANKGRYDCYGYIYTGEGQDLGQFFAELAVGNGKIQKSSSNTTVTNGNDCYSLSGATYGVYSDKESMYKLSYVIRVAADTLEELKRRCDEVKDFYDDLNVKLVRPFGDMLGLHGEFIPSSKRYINDYIQYVTSDFLAGLGFGATQQLGETDGIYIGYNLDTGKNVYLKPSLAAQGVKGSVTNALAAAFLGSLGGGKSFCNNLIIYYAVLFGGKAVIVDPKSERGNWQETLPDIAHEIKIVNLTSENKNKGLLDPYVIMKRTKDAESLAIDILTFLTGISSRDGEKFPVLRRAIRSVTQSKKRGLLRVIDELRKDGSLVAENIADHIESMTDYDFAHLLFSDGDVEQSISLDRQLNIIQVADLVLPDKDTKFEEYTTMELLSVAMLIVISTFALDFIHSDRSIFKMVDLDEAWTFLQVAQGKALSNKLIRAGRSMNAAVYFVTQNSGDVDDEKMKNNIGLKFAFRSTDIKEIKNTLEFFGVDKEDEGNQKRLRDLENGQCLFQDLYGRVGVIQIHPVFSDLFHAFDTRPPVQTEETR